jgi:hypothetical protein
MGQGLRSAVHEQVHGARGPGCDGAGRGAAVPDRSCRAQLGVSSRLR